MKKLHLLFCISIVFFVITKGLSQEKKAGPIISDFGKVHAIKNADFKVDINKEYKVVFDIMNTSDDKSDLNRTIETAARFLNMHAQAGVPAENLKVALVVHNKASKDIITSAAYEKRYGTANPNEALIQSIIAAGGEIVFCGQSSVSRDFPKEDLIDGVQLALSAMTALIQFQDNNYRFIKF